MVTLETKPKSAHATAFLIPLDEWAQITKGEVWLQPYTPKSLVEFRQLLETRRVKNDLTPVTTLTYPYRVVYLVEWRGEYRWDIVDLATQRSCCIRVE